MNILTHREHVRLRPNMYFGGKDLVALHLLILVLIENTIDQFKFGQASQLCVTLMDENYVLIADDGPGIPVDEDEETGKSILELIASKGGGRHYDPKTGNFQGGMRGAGIAAVNAVCSSMKITVKRDGFVWEQHYIQGIPQSALEKIRPLAAGEGTGTTILFQPDLEIFEQHYFDYGKLMSDLRQPAYLFGGLKVVLEDQRADSLTAPRTFHYPEGLRDYVRHLNRNYDPIHEILYADKIIEIDSKGGSIAIRVALQYIQQSHSLVIGFDEGREINESGSHLMGLVEGLINLARQDSFGPKPLKDYWLDTNAQISDVTDGLTAVISIHHPQFSLHFQDSFYRDLSDPHARSAVRNVVSELLAQTLQTHPHIIEKILARIRENKIRRDQRRSLL
jgi:DNA gyrase subunit B